MIQRRGCELDTCQIVNDCQELASGEQGLRVLIASELDLIYPPRAPTVKINCGLIFRCAEVYQPPSPLKS